MPSRVSTLAPRTARSRHAIIHFARHEFLASISAIMIGGLDNRFFEYVVTVVLQEVKKRLAKERDLDGIDLSNIIQAEGRRPRRAAAVTVSYK